MQNVTIKIDKLVGTLGIVGKDMPTKDIEAQIEEALLRVLKNASICIDDNGGSATHQQTTKS